MKKLKQQKGITLIALVITIIVLLILAGITINLTIGQDGIITKAQQAGKNYVDAANYENQMLKDFESMTDDILTNVTGGNGGGDLPVTPPAEVKVTGITLDKTSATITVGNTETLTATIAPRDATNQDITWTSDNTSVATVSNGVVTGASVGTATITVAAQDGSGKTATCSVTVNNPTLVSRITASDYGKTINYSANGVSDWKVFYNDGSNVYIIASDYIPNTLAPAVLDKRGTYNVYSTTSRDTLLNALTTQSNWSAFVDSSKAQSATGTPTAEMLMNSYNAKHGTSLVYTDIPRIDTTDSLYVPHTSVIGNCYGYWLASPHADNTSRVWNVAFGGDVYNDASSHVRFGVRPVVCLQSGIKGTVGDTNVTI